ncbi:MAG: hypothetical protein ACFFDO_06185, partial [Candidatus Thorarchaeota archaeon]
MTNRWSYLLVIFTICFFSNIASTTLEISNNTGEYIKPRTSDVGDVDFGEYKSISFTAGAGDRVQWDYSTNPSTNITVMVMNE